MYSVKRYVFLCLLLLVMMLVMGQQKEDKEIKLIEEVVKLIQFDFLPENRGKSDKLLGAPYDNSSKLLMTTPRSSS